MEHRVLIKMFDFQFQYHEHLDFTEQFFIFSELQVYAQAASQVSHTVLLENLPTEAFE
jgi:hypothetical protein